MKTLSPYFRLACWLLACCVYAQAQGVTLTARVEMANGDKDARGKHAGNVVLWLTPMGAPGPGWTLPAGSPELRLQQKNKSFEPHLLVVPVGSIVEFPNRDPFFHNVFSLFEGKRFDLGLYEAGSTRNVRFDKAGISYIFCNIHAEMSAVIIALDTPYHGVSSPRGEVVIPDVPPGRYMLHVWYETALPETLAALTREITVSDATSTLGVLRLAAASLPSHKNKYGRDYDAATPSESPAYPHP